MSDDLTWTNLGAPGMDKAPSDNLAVDRLRQAGAVVFGTNTMMRSGGRAGNQPGAFNWDVEARNPWDTSKVPGWSSSGSAAEAVAALLPFTIGTNVGARPGCRRRTPVWSACT